MLFERIEREIEKEAERKGVYFPSAESVSVTIDLSEEDEVEFFESVCNKLVESEGYWYELVENDDTCKYDLVVTFGIDY